MGQRIFGLAAALLCALTTYGAEMTIADDRMAVVDGQRTFILGLYENPDSDAVLKDVADAGFNLVHATEDAESLDRLHRFGLWAWLNTGYRIDLQEDESGRAAQLRELAATYGNHPALLVWEVPDEALWNCWYGASMWRHENEPKMQRERIDALTDSALAETLREKRDMAGRLYREGQYSAAESLADEIWAALGESQPHPGLNVSNAAERAAAMAAGMTAGYGVLRDADPAHPVWMNHAPRNQIEQLAAFNNGADIVGCDIYPVPRMVQQGHSDLALKTVASVGAYTDRMQAAAPGKPVWMVLQGFGWSDLQPERDPAMRQPNTEETRFMAYDAIVHGARGLLWWGTYKIERDGPLWNDVLAIGRELSALQPVLSAPDTALPLTTSYAETWGSVDLAVEVLGKDVDGQLWMFAVNDWDEPLRYSVHGLSGLDGQRYRVRGTDVVAEVADGSITFLIGGHGVQVLEPVGN